MVKVILMDANAIIGANQYGVWAILRNRFQLETVETCVVECANGDAALPGYVPVDTQALRTQIQVHEVTRMQILEAYAQNPALQTVHEGERDLLLGSIGDEDDPPVLRPKLHTFFGGVYDVGLCLNPDCRTLVRDGSDRCPSCDSAVRPAALCRTCGQDFAKVRFVEDSEKPPVAGSQGVALLDVPVLLLGRFQDMGLAFKRLTQDDRAKWLRTLEIEAASEFCRATQQRLSLENLALVEVRYEFMEALRENGRFVAACLAAEITPAQGLAIVRAILDHMRRHRAVSYDFFQQYIDPTHDKWYMLQQEPYLLTIPEYERHPVFFMLDRNEEARRGVGGCKFQALRKDTSRGGRSAIPVILEREGLPEGVASQFMGDLVMAMMEEKILERPEYLPPRVRSGIGQGVPLQISRRVVRLHAADGGYRCRKCQIWRPYQGTACHTSRCSGASADLEPKRAEPDHYYVKLYTDQAPRRLRAVEHTAQIGQEERAIREKGFKEGRIDVLVCSPILELGVDIGPLSTVPLRNSPPTPANYVQRAGRAGRRLRIGFVSTFCGMGPHDRHCFEDPAWLVRGEFFPPTVRMDNSLILARHIRSLVLENLDKELPNSMGDLLDDLDNPTRWNREVLVPFYAEIVSRGQVLEAALRARLCDSLLPLPEKLPQPTVPQEVG